MTGVIVLIAVIGGGVFLLRRHVERSTIAQAAPKVVLKNQPAWMSDFLAEQIARTAATSPGHSPFDHRMLIETVAGLQTNPWIRKVNQVRRVYDTAPGDTIEIDCEYRAPAALVHWGDYYWLIDGAGVKLPEQFTAANVPRIVIGADKRMNIRIIEGVKHAPPESGETWSGPDLAAGLELVRLLFDKPYAEEIVKVDVNNFAGRRDTREAQIVLITKHATQVRWGRPINATDAFAEVSPAQKLKYMEAIFNEKHHVDGGQDWIDIRFDAITYPNPDVRADTMH
jgi:hypothetical protein